MTDTKNTGPNSGATAADQAKAAMGEASEDLKARAQGLADTATTEAAKYADQAKGAAAAEVNNVASALRTAASEMRSGSAQERTFSQLADSLADASDAVSNKDLGEIVSSLTDFGRRNPAIFLGGAALIGFAASRFAKASSEGHVRTGDYSATPQNAVRPVTPTSAARVDNSIGARVASPAVSTPNKGS